MERLMTPEDVADLLRISTRSVYDHKDRFGGFYPAGLRVLRFRGEVIRELMEGQGKPNVQVQIPDQGEGLRGGRVQDESRGEKCQGSKEAIDSLRRLSIPGIQSPNSAGAEDPYGILELSKRISANKRKATRSKNI